MASGKATHRRHCRRTEADPFTAEAPFDGLRVVSRALREPQGRESVKSVEPQRTLGGAKKASKTRSFLAKT